MKLDVNSIKKRENKIKKGIHIHIFIFKRYNKEAINHPKARDQLSQRKIFAGLILYRRNQTYAHIITHINVVARYHLYINVIIHKLNNTIKPNQVANQSSQSVIFTALIIAIVKIKVKIK